MRRLVCLSIMAILLLGSCACASVEIGENEELHLLGGIPFGISTDELIVKTGEIGIDLYETRDADNNITRYLHNPDSKMSLSGYLVDYAYFRDSRTFGVDGLKYNEASEFVFDDIYIGFPNIEKKESATALSTREDLVLYLDYMVLPECVRTYKGIYDVLVAKYGGPDYSYYRTGNLEAAYLLNSLREASKATLWLSDALGSGGFATFQHICTVWNNVELKGNFSFSYNSDGVRITWWNTLRYYDHKVQFPMTSRKVDVDIDL